jgi:hypothetical protein
VLHESFSLIAATARLQAIFAPACAAHRHRIPTAARPKSTHRSTHRHTPRAGKFTLCQNKGNPALSQRCAAVPSLPDSERRSAARAPCSGLVDNLPRDYNARGLTKACIHNFR